MDRALTLADVEGGLRLSVEAGWNQTAADWDFVISEGAARGAFVADRLVATAAAIPHGPDHGWVAMVLVTQDERGRGHAGRLVRWAIDHLASGGRVPGLDATPQGEPIYAAMGFVATGGLVRHLAQNPLRCAPVSGSGVRPAREADFGAMLAHDAAVFGADRAPILRHLLARAPGLAHVAVRDGAITGTVFARDGVNAAQIGPIIASDAATATALLDAALVAAPPGPVVVDAADQPAFVEALAARGFVARRSFQRMVLGAPRAEAAGRIYAIVGPEFG